MNFQLIQQLCSEIEQYPLNDNDLTLLFKDFKDNITKYQDDQNQIDRIYVGLKRLKRDIENKQKLVISDYQAYKRRMVINKISMNPLFSQLQLDQIIDSEHQFSIEELLDYNFDHLRCSNSLLTQTSIRIFDHLQFCQKLNATHKQLEGLMIAINEHYNVVPYHNYTHAFALFQILFCCYEKSNLKQYLTNTDILAGLIASLAHDLNHKGTNNLYKLKKSKSLSKNIYESAILECMHAATFFNILTINPHLDFLSQLPIKYNMEIRQMIIKSILATDMAQHFNLLARFNERVQATQQLTPQCQDKLIQFRAFNPDNYDDRSTILRLFVHGCDISNPCLNWDKYMNWSFLLTQEFEQQTIKEKENGLEITVMLQYKGKQAFYNGQSFFLKTFVEPIWSSIAILCPELQELVNNVQNNIKEIEHKKLEQE